MALRSQLSCTVALLLAACAPARGPWTVRAPVTGLDSALDAQAHALIEAAGRVYPAARYQGGGLIVLAPEINRLCFPGVDLGRLVVTGCLSQSGIYVRWPVGTCPDLTCSALPHELAHLGGADGDGAADAGGLLIVQEWRRSLP